MAFDAPGSGCSVDSPDNSLIESISLIEGLFQHRVRNLGSNRFLCKLCLSNLDLLPDSLDWDFDFASRSGTAPVALELHLWHLFSAVQLESILSLHRI